MENKKCRRCGCELVVGINTTQYRIDHYNNICKSCHNEERNETRVLKGNNYKKRPDKVSRLWYK
jgi:hypothetical protein